MHRVFKLLVFLGCLLPLGWIVWQGVHQQLGANPIEAVAKFTGQWTLRLLLVTLMITPIKEITGWHGVTRVRRMLGLFAFVYGVLHVATYVALDQFFHWEAIFEDVVQRPYISVGLVAFLLLIPLALTSSQWAIRRLNRLWMGLHRMVYVAVILGVIHFWWAVKTDIRWPAIYATIVIILLGYRLTRSARAGSSVGVSAHYPHSTGGHG